MEEFDKLFDDYLEGRLADKQKKEFEARIVEDSNLLEQFEAHKLVIGAFYAEKDRNFIQTIGEEKATGLQLWQYISIAASILIIGLIVYVNPFIPRDRTISMGEVQKFPYEKTTRALGFAGTIDSLLIQINYVEGQEHYTFSDTLKLFLNEKPEDIEVRLKYYEDVHEYELTVGLERTLIKRNSTGDLD